MLRRGCGCCGAGAGIAMAIDNKWITMAKNVRNYNAVFVDLGRIFHYVFFYFV